MRSITLVGVLTIALLAGAGSSVAAHDHISGVADEVWEGHDHAVAFAQNLTLDASYKGHALFSLAHFVGENVLGQAMAMVGLGAAIGDGAVTTATVIATMELNALNPTSMSEALEACAAHTDPAEAASCAQEAATVFANHILSA